MSSVKAFLTIACLWDIVTAMNSGGFYPHIPRVCHLLWNILNGLGSNALFAPFPFAFVGVSFALLSEEIVLHSPLMYLFI